MPAHCSFIGWGGQGGGWNGPSSYFRNCLWLIGKTSRRPLIGSNATVNQQYSLAGCSPGVRSLISLPAGAERMNLMTFSLFTVAGTGVWNALLIGAGSLLGKQYHLVDQYSRFLNYAVYAGLAAFIVWLIIRRVKKRKESTK